jgi:sugar lactone lactonase YvrE
MRFLLSLLALGAAATAAAQPRSPEPWGPIPAAPADTLAAIDAVAALFPDSAAVQRRRLAIALEANDGAAVRSGLQRLAQIGYALSPATLDRLATVAGDADLATITARMDAERQPVEASRALVEVPAEFRLVEGVALDGARGRLYAATVVSRALLVHDQAGWRRVEGLETGSLFGVATDAPRRRLWMASGAVEPTPSPETAFRGLIALDLDSGREAARIAAPEGVALADIAVTADGAVLASDPLAGGVYRLAPGATRIEPLVAPGTLRSAQGIAIAADGRRAYVADYGYGVAIVDLDSGAVSRLAADMPAMLDGIDGLLRDGADLIAIQNGTSPRRIVRLRLDPAGTLVVGIDMIERNHPAWGEPTLGQIADGALIYVADAQWERFGPGGVPADQGPPRATAIRTVPIRSGAAPR